MAVAVDATSASAYPSGHPITVSHVVGAGTNRLLVVGIIQSGATPPTVSSCKYGGVDMTLAVSQSDTSDLVALYYLIAPTSGTANIVVTLSATGGAFGAFGISFTGVDQTSPIDASNTAGPTSFGAHPSFTENLTTVANVYIVDAVAGQWSGTGAADTPGASQTAILNSVDGASFTAAMGSYKSIGASGAQTMSWSESNSGSQFWIGVLASIQPVIVGGTTRSTLMLLGVGS